MSNRKGSRLQVSPSIGTTVQGVIDSLFTRIKMGEFPIDTRLPSERTLACELAVARNTVREALDILESNGVIRRRASSGSFVTYQAETTVKSRLNILAEETSPLDYLVIRGILEPEIVRLAVINMCPREIEALGRSLSKLEAVNTTNVMEFVKYEEELYQKIAAGTGNPLLSSIHNLVIEASHQRFRNALLRRHLTPDRIRRYQQRYNTLFNSITSRDVESAVEFIKLHLIDEQKTLLQQD